MIGFVYILLSARDGKTYTGSTDDLARRLSEHENGLVKSTKDRLPVELIFKIEFKTLEEARYMEKYYKTASGRRKLKVLLRGRF